MLKVVYKISQTYILLYVTLNTEIKKILNYMFSSRIKQESTIRNRRKMKNEKWRENGIKLNNKTEGNE